MDDTAAVCSQAAQRLRELLAQLPASDSDKSWQEIESAAHSLANSLRNRDDPGDPHTTLGKTSFPQTLTSLLKAALDGSTIPKDLRTAPIYELLRVAANLCMDHDDNRGQLLDAGFPQATAALLEGYTELIPGGTRSEPLPLAVPHLKVIKTAVGVLLNASIGYDPVKFRLISLEAAMTLMKLSAVVYPPGSWLRAFEGVDNGAAETTVDEITELWTLRSDVSNWAWRTIDELKDDSRQIFGPDILPTIAPPLLAFIPPVHNVVQAPAFSQSSQVRTLLMQTDFDILEESCMLLESLSLDVEDVRLSLARGLQFPAEHGGVPCLSSMLDFVEKGRPPPVWYSQAGWGEIELKRKEKLFGICKAAVIKAVVEVAGEERNEEVLWDDSEEDKPGGAFVSRLVDWLKSYVDGQMARQLNGMDSDDETGRDDLVICASLSLGNLCRREQQATVLLSAPYSLAPLLCSPALLSVSVDVKIKHGVLGLLKNVAQSSIHSPTNKRKLVEAHVLRCLSNSGVWDNRSDVMAEVVQISAIGVAKHLCGGRLENALEFVLPSSEAPSTGLSQILGLIRRSDNIAIKSEGTRVLVNTVKTLWSPSEASAVNKLQEKRKEAMAVVSTPSCVDALAGLVARSAKYPILINEGVVALTILGVQADGGPAVANALIAPADGGSNFVFPPSAPVSGSGSTSSEVSSPIVMSPTTRSRLPIPRSALDMLVAVLKNAKTTTTHDPSGAPNKPTTFPVELRTNVCALLGQLGRRGRSESAEKIKESTKSILEDITKTSQDRKDDMLIIAAKKALETWT